MVTSFRILLSVYALLFNEGLFASNSLEYPKDVGSKTSPATSPNRIASGGDFSEQLLASPEHNQQQISLAPIISRYEAVYNLFLNGRIHYGDITAHEISFAKFSTPLETKITLSDTLTDFDTHIRFSTGYRKNAEEENMNKLEIWLVPRFIIENDPLASIYIEGLASISSNCPFVIFFNWGDWPLGYYLVSPVSQDSVYSMLSAATTNIPWCDWSFLWRAGSYQRANNAIKDILKKVFILF